MKRARTCVLLTLSFLVVAGALGLAGPSATARAITCNGAAVTVLGPTLGHDTTGTDGDDVIVAPISFDSAVSGLGGNDTICLVDAHDGLLSDRTQIQVDAGGGDDTVLNQSTSNPAFWSPVHVELGPGADHFVGAPYGEIVFGADDTDSTRSDDDTEVDVIDAGGGDDSVVTGTDSISSPNHDVIATGAGSDTVFYAGLAGDTIDNGPGADDLVLQGGWTGRLDVDNVTRRATIGGQTLLTWTAVDGFFLSPPPGSLVSFTGGVAGERVEVTGPRGRKESAAAAVETGGGDDEVVLDRYLPTLVDLGPGRDALEYHCRRAVIRMDRGASCLLRDLDVAITELHGLEVLRASGTERLDVRGTPRADTIEAFARVVRVEGRGGGDRVEVGARAEVLGGGGDDRLTGSGGVTFFGGPGDDVLRGGAGRDRLTGGPGHDVANGGMGTDVCVAEVRIHCERR